MAIDKDSEQTLGQTTSENTRPPARLVRRGESGRRLQGRSGHLSPDLKTEIRLAFLESGGTLTCVELAKRFDCNRDTISAVLKAPEMEPLRAAFDAQKKAAAVQRLHAAVEPAAAAWVRAVEIAADKGDWKAAKELLLATRTIDPLGDTQSGVTVLVGLQVPPGSSVINLGPALTPAPAKPIDS
jgi:hypothetical protein